MGLKAQTGNRNVKQSVTAHVEAQWTVIKPLRKHAHLYNGDGRSVVARRQPTGSADLGLSPLPGYRSRRPPLLKSS